MERGKPSFGFRWVLVILGFFIYFIQYYNCTSLAVTLEAMVNTTKTDPKTHYPKYTCSWYFYYDNSSYFHPESGSGEFHWTDTEQGIILGAFYWGFLFSKVVGSRIGEEIGQRATVAIGIGVSGILVLFCPLAANLSPYALAALRLLIGVSYGPVTSAVMSLISAWAPRKELSSMTTPLYAGAVLGGTITYVLSDWLADDYGWESTFWVGGVISCIILPFWITLVRNSPKDHPLISRHENQLLKENIHITTKTSVPWLKIISSPHILILSYCYFARVWLDVIVFAGAPFYLIYEIGLDPSYAKIVCGVTYLFSIVAVIIFGRISDWIINRKLLSKIYTRNMFHFLGTWLVSMFLVVLCLVRCQTATVISFLLLIGIFCVATSCSCSLSPIDIAPNYTATIEGLAGIGNLALIIAPHINSVFLNIEFFPWNKIFYLCALLNVASCLVYVRFMTVEPQKWNFEETMNNQSNTEQHPAEYNNELYTEL